MKNSWTCCGFALFSHWQLWFHGKIVEKNLVEKNRENIGILQFSAIDNFDFTRNIFRVFFFENVVVLYFFSFWVKNSWKFKVEPWAGKTLGISSDSRLGRETRSWRKPLYTLTNFTVVVSIVFTGGWLLSLLLLSWLGQSIRIDS